MIPILIALGLVLGRWWRTALVIGVIYWSVVLVATGIYDLDLDLLGPAALALINTAVGVAIHQAVLSGVRRLRPGPEDPRPGTAPTRRALGHRDSRATR